MLVAERLRQTNRAEYLLYMWQLEDLLRAYSCNFELLKSSYLKKFETSEDVFERLCQWYEELCEMMCSEGIVSKGHLQIVKNSQIALEELHGRLLSSPKFPLYRELYYKTLPYIVELRTKGTDQNISELEVCFNFLYGILLLRMKGQTITPATEKAATDVSALLGQLSDYFQKDSKEPIDFD